LPHAVVAVLPISVDNDSKDLQWHEADELTRGQPGDKLSSAQLPRIWAAARWVATHGEDAPWRKGKTMPNPRSFVSLSGGAGGACADCTRRRPSAIRFRPR
jgi:hypothetical protein